VAVDGSSTSSTAVRSVHASTDVILRPELVRDPAEVERLLGVMSSKNKMAERFSGLHKDADGHYDRDASTSCSNTASASSAGAAKDQPPSPAA
jgi:hypothetical protein